MEDLEDSVERLVDRTNTLSRSVALHYYYCLVSLPLAALASARLATALPQFVDMLAQLSILVPQVAALLLA